MAFCYALYVAAVTLALGNAGIDGERLVEEDSVDLRVEPLVDHNTSLLSVCELPRIRHGSMHSVQLADGVDNTRNFTAGSRVEVVCETGYRFPHTKSTVLHIICHDNGSWTDLLGSEVVSSCQFIGGCPLPNIANGVIMEKPGSFLPGDLAVIQCNDGYVLLPRFAKPVITCNKDGTWTTDEVNLPTCVDVGSLMCAIPESIDNGGYQVVPEDGIDVSSGLVRSGARAVYYCDNGYRVSPRDITAITCVDGTWSHSAPLCQRRTPAEYCTAVPVVEHAHHYEVSGSVGADGTVSSGTKVIYLCDTGYHQQGSSAATCMDGEWNGRGPTCVMDVSCTDSPPEVAHSQFDIYRRNGVNSLLDAVTGGAPNGAYAYYSCHTGYRMTNTNSSALVCTDGEWKGTVPTCVKRTGCDMPMDIENGNWIVQSLFADYRIGVHVTYECERGYKAVGTTQLECLSPGYWSDYPPKCLAKDEYCTEPLSIRAGFFMCKPSQCDSFRAGTELHYACKKNYEMRPGDQAVLTCLPGGVWSREPPVCLPVDFVVSSPYLSHLSTNTITVVISSSCAVLGLLVLVMLAVALQRRLKPHNARVCSPALPSGPPSAPNSGSVAAYPIQGRDITEHDRLALIAFADDIRNVAMQAPLPSYEEAVRGGSGMLHLHGFSHYIDGGSRTSSGRSSRSADYRPLPSIRPVRSETPVSSAASVDNHRNSIITTASNNLSGMVFGSMDTMNTATSDATSTSVTVDTYDSMASNPSIVASQRATAGSIESSSTHGSFTSEAAPLLDPRSSLTPDHRDGGGGDTLRSQTSRGTHSDASSCIMEVPEEGKEDYE